MTTAVEPLAVLAGVNKFGASEEGWELEKSPENEDDRGFRAHVPFNQAFRSVPVVQLGIVGFDISNEDAARLRVRAENISAEGFDVVFETWLNSKIWSVDVSWIAIGT